MALRVEAPEFKLAGEGFTIRIMAVENTREAIHLTVTTEKGALVEARNLGAPRRPIMASIDGLPAGAYSIDVGGTEPGTSLASVSSDILIWEDPNHS